MKHILTRTVCLALTLVLATAPLGCSRTNTPTGPAKNPPAAAPETPATEPTPAPTAEETTLVRVYFTLGEKLAPGEGRAVPANSPARGAIEALLAGPTDSDKGRGMGTVIPDGTALRSLKIAGGTATVDLTKAFESGGGTLSMTLRIAQVVATLTQFSTVQRVAFMLDGKPVSSIGGEGIIVSPPRTRESIDGELPAILLESPLPGDSVSSPARVRGSANVFEAQFAVRILNAKGKVIAEKNVMATSGTGTRGTFDAKIAYPAGNAGHGKIVALEYSAKDGSEINVVTVPVTLK
jgi:hypothetical protein